MKKFLFFFAFMGLFAINNVDAQCTKGKTAAAKKSCAATCAKTAAAKAASLDATVEARTCPASGKVSYVKKNVCAMSGKVSYADVEYCTKSQKFVNVSPKAVNQVKAPACNKAKTTSAKAVKTSADLPKTKSCTAAQKAACAKTCTAAEKAACLGKTAKATSVETGVRAKLVANEEQ